MSRLICCKVYVSEGRNQAVLDALTELARSQPLCALVQRFTDPVYHRSNFTFGGEPEPVGNGALHVIEEALKRVDLARHSDATHPRVGSVDHVCFHPLGSTRIEAARDAALSVGREVGERLKVPVLLYGACNGIRLAEVRRMTSYFRGLQVDTTIESDFGPKAVDPSVGVMCVGAVPYVCNYNIRLKTTDRLLAARVTRAVRERDGGLEKVEALTLRHDGGQWEVACNLLNVAVTPPERVLEVAKAEAAKIDVEVDAAYTVGMTANEILDATRKLLQHDV